MELIFLSFFAGILTILAPCVLPLLPVIIGGSIQDTKDKWRPFVITASLAVSLVLFTLLLKISTLFINIDPDFWKYLSGGIIIFLGVINLFPKIWQKIEIKLKLNDESSKMLQKSSQKKGLLGSILIGVSLGPVFASCSPTFGLIIAVVLPTSFFIGLINLIFYALGLSFVLLLVALLGNKIITKLKWATNPDGTFRRALGIIFIIVGLAIITGVDKEIETRILNSGAFDVTVLESEILEKVDPTDQDKSDGVQQDSEGTSENLFNIDKPYPAQEIRGIEAWVNSESETLEDLKGKVVLIDFWTYSCINCIRTLPHVTDWYEKYEDKGFVVIGMHAPEFQFERNLENVQNAVDEFGVTYPVGLDNEFETWHAYNNRYWPAHYFIDREGNVRHTHFGEGDYSHSEEVILTLLEEDPKKYDISHEFDNPSISRMQTHETYLGFRRAENFLNINEFEEAEEVNYTSVGNIQPNFWTLGGNWQVNDENITSKSDGATLSLNFSAKDVYLVMGPEVEGESKIVKVRVNGGLVSPENLGGIDLNEKGEVVVHQPTLYRLVDLGELETNQLLELEFEDGVVANAFTFGG